MTLVVEQVFENPQNGRPWKGCEGLVRRHTKEFIHHHASAYRVVSASVACTSGRKT
jgi:hypothetical protein